MKKKEKGIKGWQKKDKFSLRLTEEETEAIYGNKLSFLQNQNTFSFLNFDEKMCLRVPPKESVSIFLFFIIFQIQTEYHRFFSFINS